MLPYKIRKPVYSGASKHFLREKPSSANRNDDGDADVLEQLAREDARLIGGNLQKAILLDLIDLRGHFLERESLSSTGTVVDTAAASSSSYAHPPLGTSFGQFKKTFRDRRFGAIHTRTAPRNIDRGEYAQLLYSCCFYLLEESVAEDEVDVPKNKFNLPKSIFAIFALYTLHETNPLPISPPTRQYTPRTKYGNLKEDALKEAWSILPISREEQNLYRKCYKSPVRIDRKNYLLLLELSDVCKAIVARSDDSSSHCGIAQDASYIIDKMLFEDNFFSYCEYHGPCGLEGLGGNPHFYKEHFVKQKKKKKPKPKKSKSKKNGTSTNLPAASQSTQDELEKMKSDEHFTAILNVSALSNAINKHKSNIQNVTAQLQKSRQPGGDLQPRQRALVENTLSSVINFQQAYFGIAAELNGEHALEVSRDGNNNSIENVPDDKESDRNDVLPLVFPESFSSELRGNISQALADLSSNEVTKIRDTVRDEIRARNTTKGKVVIDTSTAITAGTQSEKNGQSLSDILAFFDVQSKMSDAVEMNEEIDTADEMSMATGAGKNALETLLLMAENKMNSSQLDDDSASSDDSKGADDATIDDNSVATGSGMKALQNLLSQTTSGSAKQPTNRPSKPVKRKATSSSGRAKRQKSKRVTRKTSPEDEISVATGAGKNALQSLLKLAEDDIDSDQSQDVSISCTQKSVDDANNDDSSVATGLGMKALQSLLSQTTSGSAKQPTNRPSKPVKRKAASSSGRAKRQKSKRVTRKTSPEDEISVATGAGKNELSSLLQLAEDDIDSDQSQDVSISCTQKSVDDANNDDSSVATGLGMKALQSLLSQTTSGSAKQPSNRPSKPVRRKATSSSSSGRAKRQKSKRVTRKTSPEDDMSVATGAGKNELSSLLQLAEDDIDADQSQDGSISCTQKSVDDANNDDSSVATGLGMKALQSLLSQTTSGSAKQPTKRKKSPTKPSKSKAAPSASRKKRQKTRRDTNQMKRQIDEGDEVSVNNANTAAGRPGNDDISVASTTAAGKDALAALLSQVESVEEV